MNHQTRPSTGPKNSLPVVHVRDGAVYANSRDVAAYFGKRHDHVLSNIDNLLKNIDSQNLGSPWFVRRDIPDGSGIVRRAFDMTRDGFTLLVMGYTGQKAMGFKIAYINRFNEMEAALKGANPLADTLENPAWLRRALLDYTEKVIALRADLDDAKPIGAANGLPPRVIGGIVKGIVHREMEDTLHRYLPKMVETALLGDPRRAVEEYVAPLEVAIQHDVPQKGRRMFVTRMGNQMARISAAWVIPVKLSPETKRRMFSREVVTYWLDHGGRDMIRAHKARLAGQGEFALIPGGKSGTPANGS